MNSLTKIPFIFDTNYLLEYLKIDPGTDRAKSFEDVAIEVQNAGKPKALYKISYIENKGDDTVTLDGITFESTTLRKNVESIERVFPYIATCGTEVDDIVVEEGDFEKKIWLSVLKGKLLEASIQFLFGYICENYKMSTVSNMNSDSADATIWPLKQQGDIFSICGDVESLIGVRLTKAKVLVPDMSVAGILFPSEIDFQSCLLCHREKCPSRRAGFNEDLYESMN